MAAQDAELKLKVSLDLAFLRQQLSTIGTQLAGQGIDISAEIDKDDVVKQYNLLAKTLESKTIRLKVESTTLDSLVIKAANLKKNLEEFGKQDISLDIKIASNIADLRKSIKDKLPSVAIDTHLNEPVNVYDFIRDVAKKVDDQVKKSYVAGGIPIVTKLALPGLADPLKALQKNLNQRDPLRAKVGTTPSIQKSDVTAFKTAVSEKFKDITVKVKAELETATAAAQGATTGPSRTFLQELKDLDKSVLQSIYKAAGEDALLAFDEGIINNKTKMAQALNKAAEDASAGFIAALENKKSALFKAAGEYGGALLSGLRKTLKIQSPSREMFDIGDDAGKGFELGLLKALELAEKSATNQMRRMLDRLARMALMMGGMSAAAINRQVAQSRALPSVNFPATVPPRQSIPIGPSGTGRALPPGAIPQALPGTAFGAQKYLPTNLGIELQQILQKAAYAFVDAVRREVRTVKIGIGASMQAALPAARIAGLLPSAVGRAPSTYSTGAIGGESREQMMARRTAEAYARSALRGMDVMGGGAGRPPSPYSYAYRSARPTSAIIPYAQPGAIVPSPVAGEGGAVPPVGGGGGMRGMGGMGGFGRALGGVNLPGAGAIRELGQEFAFATQQVLLFGQAYKMLAFIQNFPTQVGAAVSQLQNFRNTLGAISPTAEEAASSNRLILDLVEKYNVPLQSARDGFTKLYASMAPAGFSGDEIRNLFTGITQAAATFGMSADKVDRVNYAFAQMASKGQVMSEELKGQLGDVLPGAMAIFAKAAGFEGSKAIQDFSAELEAGRYKGEAMVALLKNVGIVMRQEFGSGAEGAALTFQGIINRMQNSMILLYESFEPVAVGFLNTVVVPLTDGIRQISDGFNAFFTGAATKTSGGFGIAQELERLKPTFEGLGQNVKALIEQFGQFARAGLEVGKVLLQIAGNPFVGYLARVYAAVLPLTLAIQVLNLRALVPLIASFVRAIPVFVTYTAATAQGVTANKALQLAMVTTGKTAGVTATQIRTVGTAMKAAFAGTVIGSVLLGIGMLIEKIISLNASMADTKAKAMGAAQAIRSMSQTEAQQATRQYEAGAQSLKGLNEEIEQGKLKGKAWIEVTSQQAKALQDAGVIVSNVRGSLQVQPTRVTGAFQKLQGLAAEGKYRQELLSYEEKQAQQTVSLPPIPAGGGEEKGNEKALAKAAEEARRLADDKRKYEADLMNISFDQAINLSDMEFEHWKNLQQAKYDFLEAGQNEWMSRELKFQRDLQAIEIRRIETIRKAQVDTAKAEMKAATSAYVAEDSGAGGGAAMFGATGRVFNAPGWVHGHFQNMNREALVQDTVEVVMKLLQQGVKPELGSGQKFTAGMQQAQVEQLVRRGIASHKSYASGVGAIDVFVPQGTRVPVGLSGVSNLGGAAGVSGNLPRGTQLMHLDPSSRSGAAGAAPAGVPASRIRAEAKKDYASALASQEAINAKEKENLATKYANIQAQQELNVLIREYTASIVPVEQQKLENTLLQNRISLISSGAFGDALETEQKISEAREKAALGVQMANAQIEQNNKLVKDGIIKQEEADKLNASQVEKIKQLTQGLEAYIPLLRERLKLEQSSAEATLRGEITRATPLGGMGLSAGFIGPASDRFEEAIGRGATQDEASRFAELQNQLTLLESRNEAIKQSIYGIGNAFGEALTTGVASLVSGTATAKEVFASFLQSVGQALSQAASQMIATYIAIGIAKMFAGLGGGGGNPAGSGGGISDILPGASKYMEGGGAALGASAGTFGAVTTGYANGGIVPGGFRAFANGGVVSGPTLGLVGEGKYNEAIVPLPDGRSIPVQLGGRSARDLMGNGAPGMPQAPSLSMKFETTKINGVEYVSREQLEQAMAETRRASIAGGAQRGMSMTLDKIKQSPSTRSSIGIR
jgi:tape measure domain-containing protein